MKKIKLLQPIVLLLLLLTIGACRKTAPSIKPPNSYDPTSLSEVFESFWTGMNNNYVFWDIDSVNWDDVYMQYQPMFAVLDINNQDDVLKAFSYFKKMTSGLIDGHYVVRFDYPLLKDSSINPSYEQRKHLGYQKLNYLFFRYLVTGNYLDSNNQYCVDTFYTEVINNKPETYTMQMATGTIGEKIVYLRLSNFSVKRLVRDNYQSITNCWEKYLALLGDPNYSKNGVILDLRSNPGGNVEDLDLIAGSLIGDQIRFGYTRIKSGNGRLDHTPWAPAIATPMKGAIGDRRIVVLIDKWSASMAETTTMVLSTQPNTYVIGDTTQGANGPLNEDNDLYMGGQFKFANFGSVRTSSAEFVDINGQSYEGKGFPPDKVIPYDPVAVANNRDPQLEAAITYLNK